MTRQNISHTHRRLENRPETEQVYIDGDTTGAIFRALVDDSAVDEFEDFVDDELDVSVSRTTYVGFGVEVTVE